MPRGKGRMIYPMIHGFDIDIDLLSAEDPVPLNPFPANSSQHLAWRKASRSAKAQLFQLRHEYLKRLPFLIEPIETNIAGIINIEGIIPDLTAQATDYEEKRLGEFVLGRYKIWAERALAFVGTDRDADVYVQWLTSHRQAEINAWQVKCPEPFDRESFVRDIGQQLQLAIEDFSRKVFEQIAQSKKDDELEEPHPPPNNVSTSGNSTRMRVETYLKAASEKAGQVITKKNVCKLRWVQRPGLPSSVHERRP